MTPRLPSEYKSLLQYVQETGSIKVNPGSWNKSKRMDMTSEAVRYLTSEGFIQKTADPKGHCYLYTLTQKGTECLK